MIRKCTIYLNIDPNPTDSYPVKELLRYGIDGFVINFDKYKPASFSGFLKSVRNLSVKTHFFPEIIIYLNKYDAGLLPLKASQLSSLILSEDFSHEKIGTLHKDLMMVEMSHVRLYSMFDTEKTFSEIMKLSNVYRGFVLNRNTHNSEDYVIKNIKCIEFLHELRFAKIPGMILCPVSYDERYSISELSDLYHCVKDGASSIIMDYHGNITEKQLPYVKAYCDMIYEAFRPSLTL